MCSLMPSPAAGGHQVPEPGNDLRALFAPRSIAIIGASADRTKLSGLPLHFLRRHGYPGRLFPINPRASTVDGLPCFPSLSAVEEPIDLAMILLPAERTLPAVDDCLAAGVDVAVVCASGFAEAGEEGKRLQESLVERVAGTKMRILGPNCQGMVNLRDKVAASFSQSLLVERLLPGRLAFLTQSGAIGGSVMDMCQSRGIGLSHWVSTGNQADIDVVECARYLLGDPAVAVIALYLEGLKDPAEYLSLVQDSRAAGKPLIVLKSGRSSAGARAAASHTGAMAGDAAVFAAVSRQYGALLVDDVEELLDCAAVLLTERTAAGARVGIVSSSGGLGVLLADESDRRGLVVPSLQAETSRRLEGIVPSYGSTANPVDVTASLVARMMGGERGLWRDSFLAVADDANVDQLLIGLTMVTGQAGIALAEEVVEAAGRTGKPVAVCWLGANLCHGAFLRLQEAGVPVYHSPARAVRAAQALVEGRQAYEQSGPAQTTLAAEPQAAPGGLPASSGTLTEWDSLRILQAAGIPVARSILARSAAAAEAAAHEFDAPVVCKIQSPDVTHKTEIGGVRVGVAPSEAGRAYDELVANLRRHRPDARLQGVLVQEMVSDGVEVLAGITRDPQFGLILAFGLGGVMVEMLGDVALRRLPLSKDEAERMVCQVRCAVMLDGYRGRPAADRQALVTTLGRLSTLGVALGDRLLDLEINPLLVRPAGRGVCALDCVLRLAEGPSRTMPA